MLLATGDHWNHKLLFTPVTLPMFAKLLEKAREQSSSVSDSPPTHSPSVAAGGFSDFMYKTSTSALLNKRWKAKAKEAHKPGSPGQAPARIRDYIGYGVHDHWRTDKPDPPAEKVNKHKKRDHPSK